jgi:hypothetical protein
VIRFVTFGFLDPLFEIGNLGLERSIWWRS